MRKLAKYRSLFVKAIVFVVLAVLLDFLAGKGFRSLEMATLKHAPSSLVPENTMWLVSSDVVIIGASEVMHSYIPKMLEEKLGMSVYNCGNDGSRFYYQNAMISGILNRYTPKKIIWSVSPNFFTSRAEDNDRLSALNPFYHENDLCRQALNTKSEYEPVKLLSQCYVYNSRLFPYIAKLFSADPYTKEKGYSPLYSKGTSLKRKERQWNNEAYNEEFRDVMESTIKLCKERGVDLILILTPRYEYEEHSHITSYKEMKKLVAKYNLQFIEVLYHDPELMQAQYFKDAGHLNHEGAKLFNAKLAERIR